jgi:acetyltransferase-like isoleucine patch superfamily enzyme
LTLSRRCFLGDGVTVYQAADGGPVALSEGVHLHKDTTVHTGQGGSIAIGELTHIQSGCHIVAYKGAIEIGARCEIAPHCGFYPYDHGVVAGIPVRRQPMTTRGGIRLEDDVWLGFGVIVLDGVTIGRDAVVGAGAVVTHSIPDNCIAVGNPARVVKTRTA